LYLPENQMNVLNIEFAKYYFIERISKEDKEEK